MFLFFWTGKNICSQELTVPEAVIFTHLDRKTAALLG